MPPPDHVPDAQTRDAGAVRQFHPQNHTAHLSGAPREGMEMPGPERQQRKCGERYQVGTHVHVHVHVACACNMCMHMCMCSASVSGLPNILDTS